MDAQLAVHDDTRRYANNLMWKHYPLHYRLNSSERYLIWSTDTLGNYWDRLFSPDDSQITAFTSLDVCQQFVERQDFTLELEADPVLHDFDAARTWAQSPDGRYEARNNAFAVWNLLGNAYESLPVQLEDLHSILVRSHGVYDRLFYGSGLPAGTRDGEEYNPRWTDGDISDLQRVFDLGVDQFNAVITLYDGA